MMNITIKKVAIVILSLVLTTLLILGIRLGLYGFTPGHFDPQNICIEVLKVNAVMYLSYFIYTRAKLTTNK